MHRHLRQTAILLGAGLLLSWSAAGAFADEPKVGDQAPAFALKGSDGKVHALADYKGKSAVVLAWFPKAFTPGCTKECKSFAEGGEALKGLNVAYFTASVDAPDYNKQFAESLGCNYPILSDPDKSVARPTGSSMPAGPSPSGGRSTSTRTGSSAPIDKKVNTPTAAADVAAKLKDLGIASK